MNFLVTGGAGFLGSHLTRRLTAQGNSVTVLDNLHTGRIANVAALLESGAIRFIEADIENAISVEGDYDGIFNLACPASPVHYQRDPVKTLRTNVLGAANVLEFARKKNARVFQFSTSEVYGDPDVSPQNENYLGRVNQIGIRACYDEGKRAAETLFFDYHRKYGVDIRVARIFNTYGSHMSIGDGRVISNFCVAALMNEPLTIYGTGMQSRSFCFVDDLIDGIMSLYNLEIDPYQPFNLGNPEEITMIELVEEIKRLMPDVTIQQAPLPGDDPQQRKPDIQKAQRQLNWEPKVALNEGLSRTLDYFRGIV